MKKPMTRAIGNPISHVKKMWRFLYQMLLPTIALLLASADVLAAINENNLLDQVVAQYRAASSNWAGAISNAANWLFWTLAVIEMVWTGMTLALRNADLQEVIAELVMRILTIGFFIALLNFGPAWAKNIIDSLGQLANQASSAGGGLTNVTPGAVFDSGLDLADQMTSAVSFWDSAVDSLGLLFAALIVIIVFALISAYLVMTMVEIWIVLYAGIILLGFGASRFTKDFALKYLIYALSVGMKLFLMMLIIGIGQTFINQWVANWENQDSQILVAIGASVVLLALVREIPNIMQGLMSGMSFATGDSLVRSGGQVMGAGALAGAALVGAGAGMAGAASAVRSAASLAQAQGASGFMQTAAGAAKNLGSAMKSEAGDRARFGSFGRPGSGAGHRMAEAMKIASNELKAGNSIEKG